MLDAMAVQRDPTGSALADLVARQRDEIDRLRSAARRQAVIEQAKGVLAERLSCRPDEAFEDMLRLAQATGSDLAVIAAGVLGVPPPPPAPGLPPATGDGVYDSSRYPRQVDIPQPSPAPPSERTPQPVALAAIGTAVDPEELAELVREHVGCDGVLVYLLEPDGGPRLEAAANVPAKVRLEWERVPLRLSTGVLASVRTGLPQWLPDLEEARRRHTLIGDPETVWRSRAWLPFRDQTRIAGVFGVLWTDEHDFSSEEQWELEVMIGAAGSTLLALLGPDGAARGRRWTLWVQHLLDVLPGSVALLGAVHDEDGEVVDFRFEAASPDAVDFSGRRYRQLVGRSILTSYPTVAGTELWAAYFRVLRTGVREVVSIFDYEENTPGLPQHGRYTLTIGKFGDGLILAWHEHEDPLQLERLRSVQRLGNIGWGEWNLVTNEIDWSDQLYVIFDRDPALGPMSLDEIRASVVGEDLPILQNAVRRMLERGEGTDSELRLRAGDQIRNGRFIGEPVLDVEGRPVRLDVVLQDVTAMRRAEKRVFDLSEQFAQEHQVADHLRSAVLPLPSRPLELPGMRVVVRYLAAEQWAEVGGDWYHAFPIDDGSTLLAIGDVAGHGLATAAAMAKLRYALTGAALTNPDPAGVLDVLNRMLTGGGGVTLASAIVGRFEPTTRRLSWAQAGHPAPLLVRSNDVQRLDRPVGPILGAVRGAVYATARTLLAPGDTVLMFTDGLIERRPSAGVRGDDLERLMEEIRGFAAELDPARMPEALTSRLVPATPLDDTCIVAATISA
ncbi:SpoIIE family protein phosphatase [Saccharothrix luteola]|uniref:SpoIIE family protein phosphatase n=1 Tax=Saccharothrix luteola TaxID=2893018 RepID=UPI001E2C2B9F|nr:SpoIIE family protein phosphatase [Saccharothrix luteola]MCC8246846.1 SpoIIE family protein phosphatase [Saccharothrix luteola]